MEKRELIVCLLGILMVSSIVTPSVLSVREVEQNLNENAETLYHVPTNRSAFVGEVWTINQEKSFGAADLDIEDDVYVNWESHTNSFGKQEASGYLKMFFANFFTNRSGQVFDNYRLSTYKMIIYDGPSTSDNILMEQEREVLENAGDWIEELKFPVTFESNGQNVRDIAMECVVESKFIPKFLNTPYAGEHSIREALCNLHVNFGSMEEFGDKQVSNQVVKKNCLNRSEVTLNLGEIKLLPSNRSDSVTIDTEGLVDYELMLNRSDAPHEFFVNVGYSIELNRSPSPNLLSTFLGSKAEFILEGSSYNRTTNRTSSLVTDSQVVVLNKENLNRSGSFNRSFVLKQLPSELVFTVSCDVSYDKINFWKISLPGENYFDSELVRVKLEYV